MNKKIGALLLAAVCCLFAFSACSEQTDAYELYQDMSKAMENITSIKETMDGNMQISVSGVNLNLQLKTEITAIDCQNEQPDMAMSMEISLGQLGSINTNAYMKDGYVYQDVLGMKMKTEMNTESANEITAIYESNSLDFAKEAIIESSINKVDNGKELVFKLDGEKVAGAVSKMTDAFTSQLGEDVDISCSDVVYTLIVGKDSLPVKQEISFSCDLTIEGEQASASYTLTTSDFSYNNITEIEYPADLDSYELMDPDSLVAPEV